MHSYISIGEDNKHYWCVNFTDQELKVWYNNKEFMERMTRVYLPSKEEMIIAHPRLEEILS